MSKHSFIFLCQRFSVVKTTGNYNKRRTADRVNQTICLINPARPKPVKIFPYKIRLADAFKKVACF